MKVDATSICYSHLCLLAVGLLVSIQNSKPFEILKLPFFPLSCSLYWSKDLYIFLCLPKISKTSTIQKSRSLNTIYWSITRLHLISNSVGASTFQLVELLLFIPVMATNSADRRELLMPTKYQDRENNPERTKMLNLPKSKSEQKVGVVYYLTRNGQFEHPHFMEVPLSSPQGLQLKGSTFH